MKIWEGLSEKDRADRLAGLLLRITVLIAIGGCATGIILGALGY